MTISKHLKKYYILILNIYDWLSVLFEMSGGFFAKGAPNLNLPVW